ncbi:F-box and WD repeat domain containing protein 10B [Rhinoraja longicauda]
MHDVDDLCEASEFNVSSSLAYTCLSAHCSDRPCGSCYSCSLGKKLVVTKEWFHRAGDLSKQDFLKGLVRRIGSKDLLRQVDRLLGPAFGKDFTHARSSANPSLPEDMPTHSSDRSLNKAALRQYIVETWQWFAESTYWTKANYVLGVLQLCDAKLLFLLANLVRALILSNETHECPPRKDRRIDKAIAIPKDSKYVFKIDEHPNLQELIDMWPEFTVVTPDIMPPSLVVDSMPVIDRKRRVKSGSRKKKHLQNALEVDLSKIEPLAPITVSNSFQATSGVSNYKDFLRGLPIHLAKYILGLLDDSSLQNCLYVSRHWRYLAKEVTRDMLALQCIFDEVLKLQEKIPQNINPEYAKICQIPVPRVDEYGFTLPTTTFDKKLKQPLTKVAIRMRVMSPSSGESERWFTIGFKTKTRTGVLGSGLLRLFHRNVGLGVAYTDIYTEMIQMEERNVYCGAYNLKTIKSQVDPSRVIHYCGGQLIAYGSTDRKIRFLEIIRPADTTRVIQGHAGSIKALILSEDQNFVISGSFDLSIRRWNLATGYCMTIYRGHTGVITSLVMHNDKLASGAMDCLTKVWDIEQGKCISTLKHERPVRSVDMSERTVICGCENGAVHVWTLEPTSLVKVLSGHNGPVRCLAFDQWHLISGSEDANVKAWSMIGKFSDCLQTFKHPREVLCLYQLYLRVLTGCSDGKIRIFDLCHGTCLRVMRASGRGEPVLSFYLSDKSIIINTVGSVVAFRFEDVTWDYTAPSAVLETPKEKDLFKMAPLRKQPYSYVRAQRMRRIGSTNEKIYHREEGIAHGLSHHVPIMSTRCLREAQMIQSDSMKVPNLREFHFHSPGASLVGQRPSPTGWVSSTLEKPSQRRLSTLFSLDKRTDSLSKASRLLSASEQETLKQIKKYGLSRPKTSEQIRLKVNAIHNQYGFEETKINTLYNISLEDDWGRPRCPLEEMERRLTAKKHAPQRDAIEDEVTECIDVQTFLPAFDFKNQNPNPKRFFHTRNPNCFASKPTIKRSKSSLGFVDPVQFISQKSRPRTALDDIPKGGEIPADSKERNQSLTVLVPISTRSTVAMKQKFQQDTTINPFREKTGFRLCTPRQRKEYEEKIMAEHSINQQRLGKDIVFSKVRLTRNSV